MLVYSIVPQHPSGDWLVPGATPLTHTHSMGSKIPMVSSVAQMCLTLCDPMNHSTPGLPVHHQLPEFTQTRPLSRWCHPAVSSSVILFSSYPQSLPASEPFPMSQLFAWGGQSTGVSALASVLPMNTQDWSPLEWTGWISLQSKGLWIVFSNTTVQKHFPVLLLILYYEPQVEKICPLSHYKNPSTFSSSTSIALLLIVNKYLLHLWFTLAYCMKNG